MNSHPAYVFPDYSCVADQVVVDGRYVELLRRHLPAAEPHGEIPELDLVLLQLSGVPDAQPSQPSDLVACTDCHPMAGDGTPGLLEAISGPPLTEEPIEAVLRKARRDIAVEYGGWFPEFGSNNTMQGVVGFPQSKPLAFGAPEKIDSLAPITADPSAGRGVRVGVLDTQVVLHPDLAGHFLTDPSEDLASRDGTLQAWQGHATFVSGLIARQAPAATIILKSVLLDEGRSTVWETAKAIVELEDENLDVLNLSLGCRTLDGRPPLVLSRAIDRVRRRCVVVAAAGNHARTAYCCRPTWPAALPGVVAVGALVRPLPSKDRADFSPDLPWVDVHAPGFEVESTYLHALVDVGDPEPQQFTGFARWSGTSFAAATVTGAIAAGTVPEMVTARQALADLLDKGVIATR